MTDGGPIRKRVAAEVNAVRNVARVAALSMRYRIQARRIEQSVFMWHHGRCGSTVLGELLNQHSRVRWYGEIYEPYSARGRLRRRYADDLKRIALASHKPVIGMELKGLSCQHLRTLGATLEEFAGVLHAHHYGCCILLDRRNILRKLMSVQVVYQKLRRSYVQAAGSGEQLRGKLRINVNRVGILGRECGLFEMLEYIETETARAEQLLGQRFELLRLSYEDDIEEDPLRAYGKVCDFLGIAQEEVAIGHARINTRALAELIENFEQVERALSGTRYQWMLYQ
jgi:hypothetical protein